MEETFEECEATLQTEWASFAGSLVSHKEPFRDFALEIDVTTCTSLVVHRVAPCPQTGKLIRRTFITPVTKRSEKCPKSMVHSKLSPELKNKKIVRNLAPSKSEEIPNRVGDETKQRGDSTEDYKSMVTHQQPRLDYVADEQEVGQISSMVVHRPEKEKLFESDHVSMIVHYPVGESFFQEEYFEQGSFTPEDPHVVQSLVPHTLPWTDSPAGPECIEKLVSLVAHILQGSLGVEGADSFVWEEEREEDVSGLVQDSIKGVVSDVTNELLIEGGENKDDLSPSPESKNYYSDDFPDLSKVSNIPSSGDSDIYEDVLVKDSGIRHLSEDNDDLYEEYELDEEDSMEEIITASLHIGLNSPIRLTTCVQISRQEAEGKDKEDDALQYSPWNIVSGQKKSEECTPNLTISTSSSEEDKRIQSVKRDSLEGIIFDKEQTDMVRKREEELLAQSKETNIEVTVDDKWKSGGDRTDENFTEKQLKENSVKKYPDISPCEKCKKKQKYKVRFQLQIKQEKAQPKKSIFSQIIGWFRGLKF